MTIDAPLAAFLQEGLGIHLGTRNARLQPAGARVLAVRVEDDREHLIVYVPQVAAGRVLPDLESNGQAAVVFGRPIDERACQVKGVLAGVRNADETERPFVARQWDAYLTQLDQIGIPRLIAAGWTTWPAVAIRLKTMAVFEQTPGPQAGTQLS